MAFRWNCIILNGFTMPYIFFQFICSVIIYSKVNKHKRQWNFVDKLYLSPFDSIVLFTWNRSMNFYFNCRMSCYPGNMCWLRCWWYRGCWCSLKFKEIILINFKYKTRRIITCTIHWKNRAFTICFLWIMWTEYQ